MDLDHIKEETLLQMPIAELGLRIDGTPLETAVAALQTELKNAGLVFLPDCYLADEWFSPDGEPSIGIPFYLAHPRLTALEERMMLEAEGAEPAERLRLLRHEAGHAFAHAYRLQARPAWRRVFGDPRQDYAPETARPRLYSRGFVTNLEKGYAQAHPDEDWAETFAVWLDPSSGWRSRYRGWPALRKLEFVDRLARSLSQTPPKRSSARRICEASRMRTRLSTYYAKKRAFYREEFPEFFDADLLRLFGTTASGAQGDLARPFLKKQSRRLISTIAAWSRARRYTVDGLLRKLMTRADALSLRLARSESETLLDLSAYLTTLALNYYYTGKLKRT